MFLFSIRRRLPSPMMFVSVALVLVLAILTASPLGWSRTGPETGGPAWPPLDQLRASFSDQFVRLPEGTAKAILADPPLPRSADQTDDRRERDPIGQGQAEHGTSAEPAAAEKYLELARIHRKNGEFQEAADAYRRALNSVDTGMPTIDEEMQKKVLAEWTDMVSGLLKTWEQAVKKIVEKDQTLQGLTAKYPPVVLNSRRYTDGNYMGSAYSFSHETGDPEKHKNRVELEFDNGRRDNTFQVNMLIDQQNLVTDLGEVDFKDFALPKNIDLTDKDKWRGEAKAVTGHVYLEKVRDSKGDDFFALFQVIATDKDSRYVAFIWRRMPGGKVGN
jgi:hypothetical protein